MYAVGRLGSYITRGVYTVSGPFHPFGGAVDIVVVQQQDGSLKSSPWYVRFGKFQGVLKAKEKIVDINVNGVDAGFHMYLDPRGEAYFLREVDSDEVVDAVSPPSSLGDEIDGEVPDKGPVKSKSLDLSFDQSDPVIGVSNGKVLSWNNSRRSRILGFVLGRKSMQERSVSKEENDSHIGRMVSLERAEIAADLLEMNWSTNISKRNKNKDYREASTDDGEITGGRLEAGLVLHEEHFVDKSESVGVDNELLSKVVDETVVESVTHCDGESVIVEKCISMEENDSSNTEKGLETAKEPLAVVSESHKQIASNQQGDDLVEVDSQSVVVVSACKDEDDYHTRRLDETHDESRPSLESNVESHGDSVLTKETPEMFVEEQFSFSDLDLKPGFESTEQGTRTPSASEANQVESVSISPKYVSTLSLGRVDRDAFKNDMQGAKGNIRRCQSNVDIPRSCEVAEHAFARKSKSLPNMWAQFDEPESNDYDDSPFYSPVARFRSKWDTLREDASRILKSDLEKGLQFDSPRAEALSKDLKDCSIAEGGGSWSLWPFRRSTNNQVSPEEQNLKKDSDVDGGLEADGEKDSSSPSSSTMHTRSLTPTPEQLASLNLKEGKNTVTFTFSTSVLGPQQVDARIYLWRWDTRIVISDVDGTITKSDVLGQFMPLVGRDWSHIGVAHLFSAIKENGYQLLFLSARAISQASITRQFLFNLKQDGKALPDGPVVISPDGLFPSLFREVIRRAPHEFKIACLEDIKACFPPDRNPFYAGFGNRDTDEFSYLKVGIPKGKIFIINPKGEVVVNRCIDSKSYASLHSLVNGIFPPISAHEEEDFNSWNFWKLPPPTID